MTNNPTDDELLPCPFCGGEAGIDDYNTSMRRDAKPLYGVGCENNQCTVEAVSMNYDRSIAIGTWNTRPLTKESRV
ncbi:Lar family restriction alleviation protein [Sphingomonas sp. LY29]|uniref:Lar family restriction alleviation protein n=1 Tax=Sphingomonas sp. LY29 TaxID=3095341 RepID=UPI003A7F46B0